jgi:putative addiction module killer protein
MIEVFRYQTEEGAGPMNDWLLSLRDKQAPAKISVRLKRLEAGNFGDCDQVGDGVLELREHIGAGYRVYFGCHGQEVVILLCGGSKRSQTSDIKTAKNIGKIGSGGKHEQKNQSCGISPRTRSSRTAR